MDDLEIRSFKNSIVEYTNKSPLPMEVKRLVLNEILVDISRYADDNVRNQFIAMQKEKEKTDSENSPE